MSTSSSTIPPSSLGECVVCGKNATTRCSSCAQGGVDWMYFCSRDHQKLIWNAHKQVSGESFRWPAITPKEKEEMIKLSTKAYMESTGMTTWLSEFETPIIAANLIPPGDIAAGAIPAAFEGTIARVMEGRKQDTADQEILCSFRATAFNVKSKLFAPNYRDLHKLIALDPFGFLAWTQLDYAPSTVKCFEASWYSDFQHKTMILVGVLNYFLLAPTSTPAASLGPLTWSSNEVRDYALEVVEEVSSKEATEIVEVYLPALLGAAGAIRGPIEELKKHKCVGACYGHQ